MKQMVLAVGVAALCSVGVFADDDSIRVTITGCVKGGDRGSFVLTDVRETSGGKTGPTESIYWLSTNKGLKAEVGHRVEVTGTYSPSRDEGKTGTVAITSDPATGEETTKIKNGAKRAEATTGTVSTAGGTSGVKTEVEVVSPYRRLQVEKLKTVSTRCDAP